MNEQVNSSNMDDFEKQLEQDNVVDLDSQIDTSSELSEDKLNTIDVANLPKASTVPPQVPQTIKVQKNIILAFISDATGCGAIRCHFPFSYLNFVFGKSQTLMPIVSCAFIQDQNILIRARTIYFQRQMAPEHLKMVAWYKQHQANFKYRMVWEMDDFIWWENKERSVHGVPPYNFGAPGITEAVKNSSIEIMKMMDQLIVSTQYLANYIKNELKISVPVKVVPNYAAKFFWKDGNTRKISQKIEKPKFLYTGSPTHYNNDSKHYGDWENSAWREFIIKNVKENKIEFTCMGGLPFFFEEIKDKIKVIGWLNSYQYHLAVLGEKAHFGLMPLVPNRFNFSKSDLKACEYYAAKILGIGTYFPEAEHPGPYVDMPVKLKWNCSLKEIEDVVEYHKNPDNYNQVIDQQSKWLDVNGRWLESKSWVNNFLSII